jgi:outer membrane lipoprotein-sorting protein
MKKTILILFCCYVATSWATAQKAETVLDKASAAYEKSNGISAFFAANIQYEKQGISESFEGTIEMKGDKFVLKTPDTYTWYDGKTQWAYVVRTDEVNLSNPSGDELQFTNPMILLRTYKKGFNLTYIGESTSDNGKIADDVLLVSKSKNDIEKIEIQIEKSSSLPVRLTVTMKNGLRSVIRISKMTTGANQPDATFVFNPADYPDVEVVDLR